MEQSANTCYKQLLLDVFFKKIFYNLRSFFSFFFLSFFLSIYLFCMLCVTCLLDSSDSYTMSGLVRSGQVRSECLPCTFRANCCSARLCPEQEMKGRGGGLLMTGSIIEMKTEFLQTVSYK